MKFYRYEIGHVQSLHGGLFPNAEVQLKEFLLVKETPKGYWIADSWMKILHLKSKWVSKTAKKRYAYPTKKEALRAAKTRTVRRIKILSTQLEIAKSFLHNLDPEETKVVSLPDQSRERIYEKILNRKME